MIAGVLLAAITLAPSACETPAVSSKDTDLSITIVYDFDLPAERVDALVDEATAILGAHRIRLSATVLGLAAQGPAFASRTTHPNVKSARERIRLSMAPVREFTAKQTREGHVMVWLLRNITAPDAEMRRILGGDPPGYTLVNRPNAFGADAGLKKDAALILLSLSAGANGRTLAHEIGHAAGLEHRRGKGALMAEQPGACPPALNATELSAFVALAAELGAPRAFK